MRNVKKICRKKAKELMEELKRNQATTNKQLALSNCRNGTVLNVNQYYIAECKDKEKEVDVLKKALEEAMHVFSRSMP